MLFFEVISVETESPYFGNLPIGAVITRVNGKRHPTIDDFRSAFGQVYLTYRLPEVNKCFKKILKNLLLEILQTQNK